MRFKLRIGDFRQNNWQWHNNPSFVFFERMSSHALSLPFIQLLLLYSSFLQRIERGIQYSNTQSDSVQITGIKNKHIRSLKQNKKLYMFCMAFLASLVEFSAGWWLSLVLLVDVLGPQVRGRVPRQVLLIHDSVHWKKGWASNKFSAKPFNQGERIGLILEIHNIQKYYLMCFYFKMAKYGWSIDLHWAKHDNLFYLFFLCFMKFW